MRTRFCVIIDDQQEAIDYLMEMLLDVSYVEVVATFTDEQEARKFLHVNEIDFIILDVELSKTNAFHFLATLSNPRIPTILHTAHDKYEDKGYERDMIDVLLKPVSRYRLYGALRRMSTELERAIPLMDDSLENFYHYFQIKGPTRYERQIVWFKDIVYIDLEARKLCIHLVGGRKVLCRETFKDVFCRLPVKWFKLCCNCVVFNINYFQAYKGGMVVLTELEPKKRGMNGQRDTLEPMTLPVGERKLYPDFFEFLDSNMV